MPYLDRNIASGLFHASASLGIAEAAFARVALPDRIRDDARANMLVAETAIDLAAARGVIARAASLVDDHYAAHPADDGSDDEIVAVFSEGQAAKAFVVEAARGSSTAPSPLGRRRLRQRLAARTRVSRRARRGVHAPARRQSRLRLPRRTALGLHPAARVAMRHMRAPRDTLRRPSVVLFACLFASQAGLLVLSPILPELAKRVRRLDGRGRSAAHAVWGDRRHQRDPPCACAAAAGLRALLSAGAALVIVGSALSAAAPCFPVLAGAQSVIGVGVGVLVAVGIAAAGEWSTPSERPRTLAWTIAGMPAAWVLGMPLAGAAASVDCRVAWLALPATSACVALLLVRLVPQDRHTIRPLWCRGVAASRCRPFHRRASCSPTPRGPAC